MQSSGHQKQKIVASWSKFSATIGVVVLTLMVAVFVAAPASAQLGASVNEGLSYGTIVGWGTQDLRVTIMRIIQVLFGFLGVVAVLIILYAGWRWMTSGGDPQKIDEAKRTLINAALGLLVIFMAFAIVSFVIRALSDAAGPQGRTRRPPPTLPCTNCDTLGAGIIESVYPAPGARDVPRNTLIFVTFKELMDRSTLLQTIGGVDKISGQILIRAYDENNVLLPALLSADVNAASGDNLTFTFDSLPYLGDGVRDVRYRVILGCGIKKADGNNAFTRCGGPDEGGYSWTFTVGTRLDLTPPTLDVVFPQPDDTKDTYADQAAVRATGSLKVNSRPNTLQVAQTSYLGKDVPASPDASLRTTTYTCAQDNLVCVRYNGGANRFEVHPKSVSAADCTAPDVAFGGWLTNGVVGGNSITLGCSVAIGFVDGGVNISDIPAAIAAGDIQDGNQWRFRAIATRPADTLRVGQSPTYTFVDAGGSATEIVVGPPATPLTPLQIANNIATKLTAEVQNPDVSGASGGTDTVTLTATVAGAAGNRIRITPSGGWAAVSVPPFSGGRDPGFTQTLGAGGIVEALDVARNAVPRFDYSEAMFPLTVSGPVLVPVAVNDGAESGAGQPDYENVGSLVDSTDPPFVTIQADLNNNGTFDAYEFVAGTFIISNQYQTVEFQSATLCGLCSNSDSPCVRDADCGGGGATCNAVRNSCGDQIYCLPTVQPVAGNIAGVTRYQIRVQAAQLYQCNEGDASTANDCYDSSFPDCNAAGICVNSALQNFPTSRTPPDGAMDAAQNSLDGNKVNGAQGPLPGPASPYHSLNDSIASNGDGVQWTFWASNRLELKPPAIKIDTAGPITPNEDGIAPNMDVAATDPGVGLPITTLPTAQFDKLLSSSSLKPDNRYRDGRCGCTVDNDCKTGEVCDNGGGGSFTCRSQSGQDNYCQVDGDCKNRTGAASGFSCQTRQHVTLKDYACGSGGRCSGWWITNVGRDSTSDGYPDFTEVQINHTPLAEYSRYGADMGSGIKDLYQNCYLPSEGPNSGGGACNTDRVNKYCCNGTARATPCTN
ncbi:MAG: membrane protein of unknown function [Parcubacteria group bacterium Gr01-1014_31]|nr:MAG: membrane protein of unknown function [Parcubacteria group bacterium Gr01-1014_31]